MSFLHLGIWSPSVEDFEADMQDIGLLEIDAEGNRAYHRDISNCVSGPHIFDETTGRTVAIKGPDGERERHDERKPLPGVHYNLRLPEGSDLYEKLIERLGPDDPTPDKLEIRRDEKNTELIRLRAAEQSKTKRRTKKETRGIRGNAKIPPGVSIGKTRLFSLTEIATPKNVWT